MKMDSDLDKIRERIYNKFLTDARSEKKMVGKVEPQTLEDRDFFDAVKKQKHMVVDFWAPWCGPCRMVSPIVDELAQEYNGKVSFGRLNVDENPRVSSEFSIQSIPTLLFFRDGQAMDGVIGYMPKEALKSRIEKFLKN